MASASEVIEPGRLTELWRDEVILAAVGVEGAREEIRDWLRSHGFAEGRNYWAVC